MPPDVRRWLCPAAKLQEPLGLCPWFGLGPSSEAVILPLRTPVIYRSRLAISPLIGLCPHLYVKRQSPNHGRSPSVMRANRRGKATALHIKRRSRPSFVLCSSPTHRVRDFAPLESNSKNRLWVFSSASLYAFTIHGGHKAVAFGSARIKFVSG